MTNADVVVVIASVPWREENLVALCDDIAKQTMKPTFVRLLLDGYTQVPDGAVILSGAGTEWNASFVSPPRGPGERWRWLSMLAADEDGRQPAFAIIIDDDFRVGPDFVEKTVAGFTDDSIGMVAWSGMTWDSGVPHGDGVVELWAAAAGLSAVRIAAMKDIETFKGVYSVDDYFGPGGDDEVLVSYWMWKQGLKIVRPALPAPSLYSVDALQHDRRSAHRNHNQLHYMQRIALLQEHGWAPKPPELWVNPNATVGRRTKG